MNRYMAFRLSNTAEVVGYYSTRQQADAAAGRACHEDGYPPEQMATYEVYDMLVPLAEFQDVNA